MNHALTQAEDGCWFGHLGRSGFKPPSRLQPLPPKRTCPFPKFRTFDEEPLAIRPVRRGEAGRDPNGVFRPDTEVVPEKGTKDCAGLGFKPSPS
jgi:hypothetical protein